MCFGLVAYGKEREGRCRKRERERVDHGRAPQ